MTTGRPIGEEDLHAYVDGRLDPARQREIEDYLADHPDEAERLAGYGDQRDLLRAALAPYAAEPLPPELNLARLIEAHHRPRMQGWRLAAAAAVLLIVGAGGGWALPHAMSPPAGGIAALAQEAAQSYAAFAPDHERPVELRAADRGELVHWVSDRLKRPVAVPDLANAGYRFMGGRIVPTPHGPAALFLYDDDHGTRVAMLARPMKVEGDQPMAAHADGIVNGYAWSEHGLGYSLVAEADAGRLRPLADEARRQTES